MVSRRSATIRVTTYDGPGADPIMREVPWPKVPPKGALIQIAACGVCGSTLDYPAYLAGRNCEACGSPALVPCDATGAPVHPGGLVPFADTLWQTGQPAVPLKGSLLGAVGVDRSMARVVAAPAPYEMVHNPTGQMSPTL